MKRFLTPVLLSFLLSAFAACTGAIKDRAGSDVGGRGGEPGGGGGDTGPGAGQGGLGTTGAGGRGDAGTPTGDAGARPVIASFGAAPATLADSGGSVTLSWSVTGATQLSIDAGVGVVTGTTSKQVTVTATTIFTLTASNSAGAATRSTVVMVGSAAPKPLILSFTATPASLTVAGPSMLKWQVQNATTMSIDKGVGAVTGTMTSVSVAATTVYTLTATNAAGSATATTAVVVGPNLSSHGGRYAAMVAPTKGEIFIAPATLRLVASGYDPNIYPNTPVDGKGTNASKVQFFVDDAVVLEIDGTNAEYNVFKGFASGVAAGAHRVWARAIYNTGPAEVLDSPPALVTVADPPVYGQTVDLTADVSGTYSLVGTAGARVRLNGNGHRITGTGNLTLKFVDVFDLGNRTTTSQPAVAYTSTGSVAIEDSTFDNSNTLSFSLNGAATASVRRNLFRSNMRMPLGQGPDSSGGSYPVVHFDGSSTGAKAFAGNNVGAGWAEFGGVKNWIVGGDSDADSNVLIGPRVGIFIQSSSGSIVKRNYSNHVYYGGWSQGANFELNSSPTNVIEHNVIQGSSWPVRGVACEFRYNLVLDSGHQWLWVDSTGGYIHHNVFVGGEADIGGLYVLYSPTNVRINNNTIDGLNNAGVMVNMGGGTVAFSSNLLMRAPATVISIMGGTFNADYNLFFDTSTTNYSDNRKPAHDVGNGAKTDPMLTSPPAATFDVDQVGIWNRSITVRDVLTLYRMRYT
ncbi:MAG TPA: right-handed parallel beta-helix repeat-containing protein, partial [Polyangia bacterium]|nr:right-handed parallel beta-helix repeat-containing protein [Polyangia bacterium]